MIGFIAVSTYTYGGATLTTGELVAFGSFQPPPAKKEKVGTAFPIPVAPRK